MKRIICVLVLLASIGSLQAQEVYSSSGNAGGYKKKTKSQKGYDPSKLVVGGGLTALYSTDYASLGISPLVGYKFTDHFTAGVGCGILYNHMYEMTIGSKDYFQSMTITYPNIWARMLVYRNIFVDAAFEYNFITLRDHGASYDSLGNQYIYPEKIHVTAPVLLLGVGIKQPIAGRVSSFLEIMYDVLQTKYSPYKDVGGMITPVFRIGIYAGM